MRSDAVPVLAIVWPSTLCQTSITASAMTSKARAAGI